MPITNSKLYSRHGLWSLFLICALPLHLWTIILALRDFSWVAERTNAWDAIGVLSYGMVFALIESLMIFLVIALLGFLVPRRWSYDQRIALMSALLLITALWAMIGQLYFLLDLSLPETVISFLGRSRHPLRVLYVASLGMVLPTVLYPAYLILGSNRAFRFMQGLTERLSLLASFYLFLDFAGLVILVIRNL